jgi:ABC-type transport system involved in cytochrome bd biosynthesis fused ATPase/permease subunit
MHTLILLSGKQGSGKSTLTRLIRNAKEIESGNKFFFELEAEVKIEGEYFETIVIVNQEVSRVKIKHLEKSLKQFAENQNLRFLSFKI